jgi:glycosyltransferase involved in cell wall biosynthesis
MIPETPLPAASGPVVFINLWPSSGMKHYSESLVHALAPAAEVLYVRNYESCLPVPSLRVPLNPVSLRGWTNLFRVAREILRRRPAAIHLNSELPVLLPLFPLFACFNSVITLHDAVPHEGERLAKRIFMRLHLLLVFLFIRKVVVHSAAIREELPDFLQRRTHLLPHVNYRLWARGQPTPRGDGPFVVLFFGRLLRYKGLEYLLEAFHHLDPQRFALVIAGEGDLAEYHIEGANIRTLNRFIPDEEMAALFNAAHAVALPYLSASQSGVAYMAFAFEKPVVATRVGALADVVVDDQNGCLIEPRSAAALASAITRLAEPATWARLVENVRRQNFSADEEIRTRLLEIYRQ